MAHDLFTFGIPLTEKVIRTIAVYLFLLIGLHRPASASSGSSIPASS